MFKSIYRSPGRLLIAAAAMALATAAPARAEPPIVFAAASLKNALDAVADAYLAETGKRVAISYAGSSVLAQQIAEGAPADIFFSADPQWMDYLAQRHLVERDGIRTLLGNALVLIVPRESTATIAIAPGMDLVGLLGGDGLLAMADTTAVPAGLYGKAALETLGVWDSVKDRIAQAANVRVALEYVSRGESPAGIVYRTDAHAQPAVRVIGTFPPDSHPPIRYPLAMTVSSSSRDARDFFAFMQSEAAWPAYEEQRFTVLLSSG